MRMMRHSRWLLFLSSGLLAACASTPTNRPDDAMAKAQYAIAQAQQSEAGQYAAKVLYSATQKLASAKQLINQEDPSEEAYAKAGRLAQEATVDAQLAEARSEAKQAQAQAAQVRKGLLTLQRKLNQKESQQ